MSVEPELPEGAALVVGGSGGVGRAIVTALARAGSDVALTYRSNRAAADEVADEVRGLGREAQTLEADATKPGSLARAVREAISARRRLHTIVNAAGSSIPMRFIHDVTPELFREVMEADALGFFELVHAALPHLRDQGGGSFVAVSSVGLARYPARDVLSVAPKATIEVLIKGIAREEGRYGIRANSVGLGVIEAGMFERLKKTDFSAEWVEAAKRNTALRRFGTAEEVADTVVFLASKRASYVTGQTIQLDGGYSI